MQGMVRCVYVSPGLRPAEPMRVMHRVRPPRGFVPPDQPMCVWVFRRGLCPAEPMRVLHRVRPPRGFVPPDEPMCVCVFRRRFVRPNRCV